MIKSEKGQATVELAISLTILMFILFIIIDFGRVFYMYLTLEHAGREAARIASLGATDTEIVQRARAAAPTLNSNLVSVSIAPDKPNRLRGTYVTVNLSYSVSITTPLLQKVLPDPLVISGKTVMRVE